MSCRILSRVFFFFKQKTAYEMRISDWSSDVCSSDLVRRPGPAHLGGHIERLIGTMIGKLRLLPGATGSNVAARDGYDAEADAAMTLVEFERWLLCQIAIYHHAPHSALGGLCPAQMWEREGAKHRPLLPVVGDAGVRF